MTPHSMSLAGSERSPFTTPYPVTAVPGSIPSTIMQRSRCCFQLHVAVRCDFLNVVQLFQFLEKLHQGFGSFPLDVDHVLRNRGNLRLGRDESLCLELAFHRVHVCRIRMDDKMVAFRAEILTTC